MTYFLIVPHMEHHAFSSNLSKHFELIVLLLVFSLLPFYQLKFACLFHEYVEVIQKKNKSL